MKNFNRLSYYLAVFTIIIISFFLYSSNFYPLLCSDDALNILMAHYYKLPADFYCWGQDRGGTLIPLISQVFIKIFHFSALTSVSLSNYLILILGFLCFSSLFKTKYGKLIFAVIWFLPFERFTYLLRYPIGVEYSLVAIAFFLINKLSFRNSFYGIRNHLLLISTIIILVLTVWVSDLAIVTIGVLLVILLVYNFLEKNRNALNITVFFYFLIGVISCLLFIKYAKSFAINKTEHYLSLNNFASIKSSIQIIITAFIEVLTFKRKEIFVSVYTYLVITFLITLFIHILKKKLFLKLFSNKWVSFFIADFISIFITFLMSSWVLANGMGRWYFVASYISLSVAIVLIIESIEVTKIFRYYLLLIIVIGAISPVYNMKYISPKRLRPMVDVVGEFKQLGKIGILAEFWNSYIASCSDPEMIKATPNDKSGIRNQKLVDEVFERKNIYVIKDMWLDFFPDTLEQFGYVLLKQGKQFRLGDCDVCKYEKIKKNKSYSVVDFKHKDNQIIFDYPYKKNVLSASYSCDTCKEKYLIYGPYIPLGIGDFKVRFCIKVNNPQNENSIALLDVSANWGNNQLANKRITKTDLTDNSYNYFDLYFKTTQRVNGVEFRIYYYGNANLYFDHLELLEK